MVRNKEIIAKTTKAARTHIVSFGGILLSVVLLIIGIAAFKGGYTNVGSVFIAFGGLVTFLSIVPMFDIPGWAMAAIILGSMVTVIIFTMPYIDAMMESMDMFMEELPTHIWEWLLSNVS